MGNVQLPSKLKLWQKIIAIPPGKEVVALQKLGLVSCNHLIYENRGKRSLFLIATFIL